jgi:hypothetical protein
VNEEMENREIEEKKTQKIGFGGIGETEKSKTRRKT